MTKYFHSSSFPSRFISVSHHHFNIFRLALFSLVALFASSCEEGPTKIGSGLLPGSDFVTIKSIDTLSVWSYTMYDRSIRTDNPSVSYLGQIKDPYFGTTTAEFVTQIRLASAWSKLNYTVDTVQLYLTLLDVNGGSGGTHTLRLSEIADQINTDSVYYSDRKVDTTNFEVTVDLPVLQPDTINNIVLNVPVELGNYLIRDTSKFFYGDPGTDFRSYFKGLYFRLSSGSDPLLVSLSLAPPTSFGVYNNYFRLIMHDDAGGSGEFYFILDAMNRNASFNLFSHDFNTAGTGKKIEHINDGYRDTLSYLQYLNGLYTRITLPGLEILKNDPSFKKIAINKARLTIPLYLDGDIYKASTVPSNIRLRYKTKSGYKYDVPDYTGVNPAFFDGTIDTIDNVYNFNIPAFVQGYLEDVTDNIKPELEMYQPAGTRNVILKANSSKTPVIFEFTYTKF